MSFKISFDIKCDVHNTTIYKATVNYYLIQKDNNDKKSNYFCYKHEIEFKEIRLIPRKAKDNSVITSCFKAIQKAPKELQIRRELLKENEIYNNSNQDLEIVLSNSINSSYLEQFNTVFNQTNQTINNAYKYIMGVNPTGHKSVQPFNSNILIDITDESNKDYLFNNCRFIQFFTYILGDSKNQKSFSYFDKKEFEEISLYDFLNNHLENFFYQIFLLSNIKHKNNQNKVEIDANLERIFNELDEKNHYFDDVDYEKIKNDFDWSKWTLHNIKEVLINKLIDLNQGINDKTSEIINKEDYILRDRLLEELEITSRRYITNEIANAQDIKVDYVYHTFRKELSCVQNCHIFNIKDAKNCFKKDLDSSNWRFYLNSMSDISNILLLTTNIHSLFDANVLKVDFINQDLNNLQFIENNKNIFSLNKEESEFLHLKNLNIWEQIIKVCNLDLKKMKQYILKRNELIK